MRSLLFALFFFGFVGALARAQEGGTVSGIVVSTWDGAALSGVAVSVRGTTLATQTGQDGRFELKNVPTGDQTLRFSKSGFASAVVTDVRVLTGQSSTVNGNLRPEFYEMEEYEVTAEIFTEQTEKILIERQQSSGLMDAIGSEQFSKLGAGDAGAIVARVTGVSLVGGKYAVVRGLSDRYTRTLLNGVEIPSADPYRMSPQLDLFPSAMIDRINVSKTFSPDQPGGSGGGTIDIITKPFPEKPFVKGSVGTSYNTESNLKKNFLADPKSDMGLFAPPSGSKPLASDIWALTKRVEKPRNATSRETAATAQSRREEAEAVSGLLRSLGTTDFAGVEKTSPLNSALNVSAGQTLPVLGFPLGMFAALNYNRNFRMLEQESARYVGYDVLKRRGVEQRSNITTDYGANVNLGYHLSDYAEFGFNFMLAHSTDEEARHGSYGELQGEPENRLEEWQLHFTEREIRNYQLHGHHELPVLADSKLDWVISLADTSQDEPNQRFMNYFVSPSGQGNVGNNGLPVPFYPSRYYREIAERSINTRADWTLPLQFTKEDSKFKFGFSSSSTDRTFREQYFGYSGDQGFNAADPNSYLNDPALLDYTATHIGTTSSGIGRTNYSWQRFTELVVGRPYSASQNILAGYPMVDLGLFSWLRLIGGARIESTLMQIDTRDQGSSIIDQVDALPAVAAVINFRTNVALRLSYSETIARPSFREKSPIINYLPELSLFAQGNPELQMSRITSYDARLEWFPNPGDLLSAGVFLKQIKDPIELYVTSLDGDDVTWRHRDKATVAGIEFEGRKSLDFLTSSVKGFSLGANVALIQSETALDDVEFGNKSDVDHDGVIDHKVSRQRPLYDQSPYIINLELGYTHPTCGTSFTLAANMTGERIILTTSQGPDVYEHLPISLDAMLSQKIGKAWQVRFGVKNILDPEYRQTYGASFSDNLRYSYHRGRTFSLSVGAEF